MIACGIGRIERSLGESVTATLPGARIGDGLIIEAAGGRRVRGTVAAIGARSVTVAPLGSLGGVASGDRVRLAPEATESVLGFGLANRAVDAAGEPLDGGLLPAGMRAPVDLRAPEPGRRVPVTRPFWTGVRAIDGVLTIGAGARVGLFGAPGAGKSTLLETIVAGSSADAVVVGLVGERGREAQRWIATLRAPAVAASRTIVCATSDRSASERVRAAELAMAQAMHLRDRGLRVLLVVDSLARYVAALRERSVGLGEPAGRGGYPPSVFAALARYLECAGNGAHGAGRLTTIATVLPDGGDDREPLTEAARSLLDGHLALSSELASAGRFPAIDVVASASRTMNDVVAPAHRSAAARVRAALARLAETRDLRAAGLTDPGDAELARLVRAEPALDAFLRHAGVTAAPEMLRRLGELRTVLGEPP